RGEPLGGLRDRAGRRVPRVVVQETLAVQVDTLDLADHMQITPLNPLHVDVAERLQPGTEPGRRTPYPPGDRTDPAVAPGQHRDDAVGLPQLLYPQDHRVVARQLAVEAGHTFILRRSRSCSGALISNRPNNSMIDAILAAGRAISARSRACGAASDHAASPWPPVRAGRGRPGCRAAPRSADGPGCRPP